MFVILQTFASAQEKRPYIRSSVTGTGRICTREKTIHPLIRYWDWSHLHKRKDHTSAHPLLGLVASAQEKRPYIRSSVTGTGRICTREKTIHPLIRYWDWSHLHKRKDHTYAHPLLGLVASAQEKRPYIRSSVTGTGRICTREKTIHPLIRYWDWSHLHKRKDHTSAHPLLGLVASAQEKRPYIRSSVTGTGRICTREKTIHPLIRYWDWSHLHKRKDHASAHPLLGLVASAQEKRPYIRSSVTGTGRICTREKTIHPLIRYWDWSHLHKRKDHTSAHPLLGLVASAQEKRPYIRSSVTGTGRICTRERPCIRSSVTGTGRICTREKTIHTLIRYWDWSHLHKRKDHTSAHPLLGLVASAQEKRPYIRSSVTGTGRICTREKTIHTLIRYWDWSHLHKRKDHTYAHPLLGLVASAQEKRPYIRSSVTGTGRICTREKTIHTLIRYWDWSHLHKRKDHTSAHPLLGLVASAQEKRPYIRSSVTGTGRICTREKTIHTLIRYWDWSHLHKRKDHTSAHPLLGLVASAQEKRPYIRSSVTGTDVSPGITAQSGLGS